MQFRSRVPANAAVASAIIVALETASRTPGLPGVRLRCDVCGVELSARFNDFTGKRRALQLHSERRGRCAPSVAMATAIATFQIITCLLSTWNTHDTCAHCAQNTCDLLLSPRYFVRLLRFLDLLSETSKIFRRLVINTESVSVSILSFNSGFFKFV